MDKTTAGTARICRAGQPFQLPVCKYQQERRQDTLQRVEGKRHSGAPLRRAPHPELAAHHHWHIGTDEDIRVE